MTQIKKKAPREAAIEDWATYESPPQTSIFGSNPYGGYGKRGGQESEAVQPELILPKEKIAIYCESKKIYVYCVNGSVETLQLLFK